MRRRQILGGGLVLSLLSLFSPVAPVASEVARPLSELVAQSDAVLVGTVSSIRSVSLGPLGRLYSVVRVQPESFLRGRDRREPLEILVPGGISRQEDRAEWWSHQARFRPGERVALVLTQAPIDPGRYRVLDGRHGKFALDRRTTPRAGDDALSFLQRIAPRERLQTETAAQLQGFDFLTVATHEQGHFGGLGDLYDSAAQGGSSYRDCMDSGNVGKTMFGFIDMDDASQSTLERADRFGYQWLYGSLNLPIPNGANNSDLFSYFCSARGGDELGCSDQGCVTPVRWAGSSLPVPFHIAQDNFLQAHVTLLRQAFASWENVPNSAFTVRAAGDTPVDIANVDNFNLMRVSIPGNQDDNMLLPSTTVAITGFSWRVSSGDILDADITFNHRLTFIPPLPDQQPAPPTPTPVPNQNGGGCGQVSTPPHDGGSGGAGQAVLCLLVALALWMSSVSHRKRSVGASASTRGAAASRKARRSGSIG